MAVGKSTNIYSFVVSGGWQMFIPLFLKNLPSPIFGKIALAIVFMGCAHTIFPLLGTF